MSEGCNEMRFSSLFLNQISSPHSGVIQFEKNFIQPGPLVIKQPSSPVSIKNRFQESLQSHTFNKQHISSSPYAYPIQHFADQSRTNELNQQLSRLTSDLAVVLLDQEIICQQQERVTIERSQPSTSNTTSLWQTHKRVSSQLSDIDSNMHKTINLIANLRKQIDSVKVKRRHLRAKLCDGSDGVPHTNLLLVEIVALKQIIRENTNERENNRFSLVSKLETEMRAKAEIEAMKAAKESQWTVDDNECSQLSEKIDHLERRLKGLG